MGLGVSQPPRGRAGKVRLGVGGEGLRRQVSWKVVAHGAPTLTLHWLSAETPGSRSWARQRPPEQTTGWQPQEEVMGLAPTRGAAPGDWASHPPAACQRLPAQVAQALLWPKPDPPHFPGDGILPAHGTGGGVTLR